MSNVRQILRAIDLEIWTAEVTWSNCMSRMSANQSFFKLLCTHLADSA